MYTVYENTMDGRDVANFDATQAWCRPHGSPCLKIVWLAHSFQIY